MTYTVHMWSFDDPDAHDEHGDFKMPFRLADYGEDNGIVRSCEHCKKEAPQGSMKELSRGSHLYSGTDNHQLYADGFFVCALCWEEQYAYASWQA